MPRVLQLTIRFLTPLYHGRSDGGEPEWPPSPLRLFQALTAAFAPPGRGRAFDPKVVRILDWLQKKTPEIVAPVGRAGERPYRLYVPNNAADLVAAAWKRGNSSASIAEHRTEKDVRPTHLGGDIVYYLYSLPPEGCPHEEVLRVAARSITHLGWGVDMVAGDATVLSVEEAAQLPGERWRPSSAGGVPLRVPKDGTLTDLLRKHTAFLNRLSADGFKPVPPLSAFRIVHYARPTDATDRLAYVPFRILSVDPDAPNPAFETGRRARDVASSLRHAAGRVYVGDDAATFIHGHDPDDAAKPARHTGAGVRLHYLPLPTINYKLNRVESIRRVLIAGPVVCAEKIRRVGRRLEGEQLIWDDEAMGLLAPLTPDWVLRQYVGESRTWSTVTPVILPGYDDRDNVKAGALIRKAFRHAELPEELLDERECELAWRNVGFRPGVNLASQYIRPDKLTGRAVHVRVRFPVFVRGPLAIGAGRYRGFGLFAAEDESR